MTVILYGSNEGVSISNGTDWNTKLTVQGNTSGGEHIIWIYCEYASTNKNNVVSVRGLLDTVEHAYEHWLPDNADDYVSFSAFGLKNLDAGSHSVVLEFKSEASQYSCSIRRARILVMKH